MARFRVVYCGSAEVPAHLIKPILNEIDADLFFLLIFTGPSGLRSTCCYLCQT